MPSGVYKHNKGHLNYNPNHTEETKKKIKEHHSRYWLGKKNLKISGKNNYNWKGGISRDRHVCNYKYKQWRSDVFKRDNWTCQTCGKRGCYLEPHHIKGWAKYPELRYVVENGVTLCKECHKLTDNYKGKGNRP